MKLAKSNQARSKIRQWFKREKREENVAHGRTMFESELKHLGLTIGMLTTEEMLPTSWRRSASTPWRRCTPPSATAGPPPRSAPTAPGTSWSTRTGKEAEKLAAQRAAAEQAAAEREASTALDSGVAKAGEQEALGLRGHRLRDDGVHGEVRQVLCTPVPGGPHCGLHHPGVRGVRPPGGLSQRRDGDAKIPRRRTGGSRSAGTPTA